MRAHSDKIYDTIVKAELVKYHRMRDRLLGEYYGKSKQQTGS